tara:strand:+ start:133 stop:492 length:360 start_codon:yes stop_codon:yes gene_type:complete
MKDVAVVMEPVVACLESAQADLAQLTPEELAHAQQMVEVFFKGAAEPVDDVKETLNHIIYSSIRQVIEAESASSKLGVRPATPMLPLTSVLFKQHYKQEKLYDALLKTLTTLHSQAVAD